MAEAGGSASAWQVLLLVRSGEWGTQSGLAKAMGGSGATVTHHPNALESQGLVRRWRGGATPPRHGTAREAQGLVRRWREEANRRVQRVELTDEGAALFERLREVATLHDARLRSKLTEEETAQLAELLDKLRAGLDEPG